MVNSPCQWSRERLAIDKKQKYFFYRISNFLKEILLKGTLEYLWLQIRSLDSHLEESFKGCSKTNVKQVCLTERSTTLEQAEVVVRRCSVKKVFLEISQDLQENTCVRVSLLIKLQACNLIKREALAQLFSC